MEDFERSLFMDHRSIFQVISFPLFVDSQNEYHLLKAWFSTNRICSDESFQISIVEFGHEILENKFSWKILNPTKYMNFRAITWEILLSH